MISRLSIRFYTQVITASSNNSYCWVHLIPRHPRLLEVDGHSKTASPFYIQSIHEPDMGEHGGLQEHLVLLDHLGLNSAGCHELVCAVCGETEANQSQTSQHPALPALCVLHGFLLGDLQHWLLMESGVQAFQLFRPHVGWNFCCPAGNAPHGESGVSKDAHFGENMVFE